MKALETVLENLSCDIEQLKKSQDGHVPTYPKPGCTQGRQRYLFTLRLGERVPAIVLGCVGLLGILIHRVVSIANVFSFLNMPPEVICYLITISASVLFGLSMICKKSEKEIEPRTIQPNWRSM